MNYEIAAYAPRFRDQVLELQRHLWGTDRSLNLALFDWKYLQNPFLAEPLIYLVLAGGKVVGMRGFMGTDWQFGPGEPTYACPIACDLVIDPEHRGRGLFRHLMGYALSDLAHRGYQYVFNLSANPINYHSSLKTGWRQVMPYRTLRRDTKRARRVARVRQSIKRIPYLWRFADNVAASLSRHGFGSFSSIETYALDDGALRIANRPDPALMAEVAMADMDRGRLRPVSSPRYFAWRLANPVHVYRVLIWENPHPLGYVVLQRRRDDPLGAVRLVDFSASCDELTRRMLHLIFNLRGQPELTIWSATLGTEVMDVLGRHGFTAIDETRGVAGYTPGVLVRRLGDSFDSEPWSLGGRNLLDAANWRLRMVLSDSF